MRDSLKFRITATATLAAVVWVAFLIAGSGLLHGAEAWRAPCDNSRSGQSGLTITYPLDGTVFPPEIVPPRFIWEASNNHAERKNMSLRTLLEKHGKVGLGGEGILRTYGRAGEARDVIKEALDQGITYFDSAHVYADSEVYYGSVWREQPDVRARVFQASKSATRDREGAMADLESTLERMGTEYLDLWQIHDVRTRQDLDILSGAGGALEAFVKARSSGKVRYIGVTGHHDPAILKEAVEAWPVDAVMMPVNPVEAVLGGFLTSTLPAAKKRGIAVIGMKVLGGSHYLHPALGIPPEVLIRFALSFDVSVAIVGCSTRQEVRTLAGIRRETAPLVETERASIVEKFKPYASELAFYRGIV